MKILIVNNKFNGKKLLSFLKHEFPSASDSTFYKALRKKDICANDNRVSENITIYKGDEIKLYVLDKYLEPKANLSIVYEDENILIVNKPKEIEVTGENSLTSIVQQIIGSNKLLPCHRLDRNTSRPSYFCKKFFYFRYIA